MNPNKTDTIPTPHAPNVHPSPDRNRRLNKTDMPDWLLTIQGEPDRQTQGVSDLGKVFQQTSLLSSKVFVKEPQITTKAYKYVRK